jgi:hypothetical protein
VHIKPKSQSGRSKLHLAAVGLQAHLVTPSPQASVTLPLSSGSAEKLNRRNSIIFKEIRLEVLTAVSMKMGVFWDVAPCSLADIDRDDKGSKLL